MKARIVCLLLALALMLSLFAACGGAGTAESTAADAQSAAAETESTPETEDAEAPADEEEVSADEKEVSAEEAAEAPAVEEVAYELPLTDEPVTYTMFTSSSPTANGIEKKDNLVWNEMEERTGVYFEIDEVTPWSFTEQFMLMVAGGDWADVLTNVRSSYSGGLAAALNEEVIMDLSDYTEYFPNYYNIINADPNVYRDVTLGDGEIGAFYGIFEEPRPVEAGLLMRGDWLDKLGIDSPTTVDEYYEALKAIHEDNGSYMHLPTNGILANQAIMSAYDVAGFYIDAGFFTSLQCYTVVDDTMLCGFQQEGFKEYLQTLNKWYSEGLIDQDYMSSTSSSNFLGDGSDEVTKLLNDKFCLWGDSADMTVKYDASNAVDPNFEARPTPFPTLEKGGTVPCGEYVSRIDEAYYSLSTACENPELALQFFDYSYTEEGYMLQNWGVEGETYVTNSDGTHTYTDLVLNNPDYTVLEAKAAYLGGSACVRTMEAYHALHNDMQMECFDVWNSNFTAEHQVSTQLVMTTDESTRFSEVSGDMITYLNECIAKFIVGEKNFDSDYDEFQDALKSLGIEELNEIEQAVYDRWAGIG